VLSLGFVLELPWDVGVPSDFVAPYWSTEGDAEPPSRQMCDAMGVGTPPSEDHALLGWVQFNTVTVPVQLPLAASDLAFGHLRPDVPDQEAVTELAAGVRREVERAVGRRTVAFVSVIVESIGDELADAQAFIRALELLNAWMVSLGVSLDMRLRPLNLGDLPPNVPYMPTLWHEDGTFDRGLAAPMSLRTELSEVRVYTPEELRHAAEMFAIIAAGTGLATFYELVQRAGSSMSGHRYREAVIDYTTAGELFITEMYREVAVRRGEPDEKISNIVAKAFADRPRHLSRLLGRATEPTDPDSVVFFWWLHCYRQRNPIVHSGHDSMPPLAEMARIGLVTMVAEIRDCLRADPQLADLAPGIQWAHVTDETGEGRDSFPDGHPRAPAS
jgi:hypothetical protein